MNGGLIFLIVLAIMIALIALVCWIACCCKKKRRCCKPACVKLPPVPQGLPIVTLGTYSFTRGESLASALFDGTFLINDPALSGLTILDYNISLIDNVSPGFMTIIDNSSVSNYVATRTNFGGTSLASNNDFRLQGNTNTGLIDDGISTTSLLTSIQTITTTADPLEFRIFTNGPIGIIEEFNPPFTSANEAGFGTFDILGTYNINTTTNTVEITITGYATS